MTERKELPDLERGEGLGRVGKRTFVVRNLLTDGGLSPSTPSPACAPAGPELEAVFDTKGSQVRSDRSTAPGCTVESYFVVSPNP